MDQEEAMEVGRVKKYLIIKGREGDEFIWICHLHEQAGKHWEKIKLEEQRRPGESYFGSARFEMP